MGLYVSNDLALRRGGEGIATLGQDLHHVLCEVTASQIQTEDGVWQGIALVDWNSVADTIATVHDDSSGTARCIQRQHSLNCHIHRWYIEGLKHDLRHSLTIRLGVQRGFRQQDWMLFRSHTQLVVEGVMPNLLLVTGA